MASEMTFKEFQAAIRGYDTINQEVMHYLSQGVYCFTVSAGPWTLTFDNSKESEVNNGKA